MHTSYALVAVIAYAFGSFAAIVPLKNTDPGQSFTVVSTSTTPALNGQPVNLNADTMTASADDFDVVTKLGAPLIFQLRKGVLFSQQQTAKTFEDTGLVGGLEIFEPPLMLFQFRNESNLFKGSSFDTSIKKWSLNKVGTTGSTYDLLATTTSKSHGFFACLTPDKPPTRFVASVGAAKKTHYVIVYSSGGGTPPDSCKAVTIQTTLT